MKKKIVLIFSLSIIVLFGTGVFSTGAQAGGFFLNDLIDGYLNSLTPVTPIQHIIIIMNENHAFDNFFGTYPGVPSAYGLDLSTCLPLKEGQTSSTPCLKPFNADEMPSVQETDQCHTNVCSVLDVNGGKMNGFVYGEDTNNTMAYYDGSGIPQLWDLASYFDLDYNFYSSALSYSEANHLFAVSANTQSAPFYDGNNAPDTPLFLNFTYPEIGSELTARGITWGYFQYNWNDAADCTGNYDSQTHLFTGPGDSYWEGEAQFRKVQNTMVECSSLGNIKDFESALASNTLPAVSWVEPEPSESCHPGQGTLEACQLYTTSLIDDIEQSPEWAHSVTFLTFDEYGGYYDNVSPTTIDEWGDGFRVPLIAISPYTIQGLIGGCTTTKKTDCAPSFHYVDNATGARGTTTREDFSAFLSTIEYNWNLKNLSDTDGEEPNLFYMLNFHQTPLQPLFFSSDYSQAVYPLSACYSSDGCRLGTPFAPTNLAPNSPWVILTRSTGSSTRVYTVYNATMPSWAEPNSESANYSGGDPDD